MLAVEAARRGQRARRKRRAAECGQCRAWLQRHRGDGASAAACALFGGGGRGFGAEEPAAAEAGPEVLSD